MEFSSLFFLYVFLPLTAAVYFLMPGIRRKNIVLIAASLLFYAVGQPVYLLLLLGLSYVNYYFGGLMKNGGRSMLILAIAVNLLVLGIFKYLDFFLGFFGVSVENGLLLTALRSLTEGLNSLLGTSFRAPETALPIGISFYTFQAVSYLVDIYRGKTPARTASPNFCCTSVFSRRSCRGRSFAMNRSSRSSRSGAPIPA